MFHMVSYTITHKFGMQEKTLLADATTQSLGARTDYSAMEKE